MAAGIKVERRSAAAEAVLTPEALKFVEGLHRRFNSRREELLRARAHRQAELESGKLYRFLPETEGIRRSDWRVPAVEVIDSLVLKPEFEEFLTLPAYRLLD